MKESQRVKEEGERSSPAANHVNHLNVRERTRDFVFQANSSEPWNKEAVMLDGRTERQIPNSMRKESWMNGGIKVEDQERQRARMMMDEERRRRASQQPKFYSHNTNPSSHPLRETTWMSHSTDRNRDNHRSDVEAKLRGYERLQPNSIHRTYRSAEQNGIQDEVDPNDPYGLNSRGRNDPFEKIQSTDFKREPRNVKFDLHSLRISRDKDVQEEAANPRNKEKEREKRHKVQLGRSLKVKLNLNPLKNSKVHPRRRSEEAHAEHRSSKRSKEKRKERKREGLEKGEKHDKKTKSSHKKRRKSSKSEALTKDGEEEEEQKGETGETSKLRKTTSKSENPDQESPGDQVRILNPDSSQPAVSAASLHQYQAGPVLSRAQLLSQRPFSFLPANRNRTTSLSLGGSAGSQLTGSSLSMQTGSVLLNTLTPGSNPLLPAGLAASGVGLTGLNVAPGGSSETLSRQAAGGMVSAVPLLLAKTVQSSPGHSAPPQMSQSEEPVLSSGNQAADPALGQGFQTGEGLLQLPNQNQEDKSGVQAPELETVVENMSSSNSQPVNTSPGGPQTEVGSGGSMKAAGGSVPDVSEPGGSTESSSGAAALLQQEYLSEEGGSSPRRRLRLILPEKTSNYPPTALERKIR